MGNLFCKTKPGCPPCDRFRGFGPEWEGDLCNMGEGIFEIEYENGTFVAKNGTAMLKPEEVVAKAISNSEDEFVEGIKNIKEETQTLWHDFQEIWHYLAIGLEMFVGVVIAAFLLYILFNVCSCICCCCKCVKDACPKCRTSRNRPSRSGGKGRGREEVQAQTTV